MKLADKILERKAKAPKNEQKIEDAIQALIDTKASDDNKDQGQFVQLLKGIAFSDDPKSDKFMKKLTTMVNDKNFGNL